MSEAPPPPAGRVGAAKPPWASASSATAADGATTSVQAVHAHSTHPTHPTHPTAGALQARLPSAETQRQVGEARAALVASMSNLLDAELQGRAATLHEGAAGLERQQREVARATEARARAAGA